MKAFFRVKRVFTLIALVSIMASALTLLPRHHAVRAASDNWSTYMGTNGRTSFNGAETIINPASAPHLKLHWKRKAAGRVTTQPIAANGLVYWGSWDGVEHATNPATGVDTWVANLGQSTASCSHTPNGVLSSAAVASVPVNGVRTPVVFVGGGDAATYALNAKTGSLLWRTSLGSVTDTFLYGSPAVYKGSVYIGVASHDDCPLIQGQLVQLNAATGTLQHTFNVVPSGCTGGSVWVAPTIDASADTLYVGTGNTGTCSTNETMAEAFVALRTTDLSLVSFWQIPLAQQSPDGDFGSTATLFQVTIGGVVHQMVGLLNKNGIYYAFERKTISAGPIWHVQLAAPASTAENNVASSAWDGTWLYAAAGSTTINGASCAGSLRALNPASGVFQWQDCFTADILGPVTAVPGVAEVGSGTAFMLVATKTGKRVFSFVDTSTTSHFAGPGSIANGILYHGNTDGYLYAFGT